MEKPDEGYDSTGEVGSLLIVVALFSNVVDCRPSQESGLLINQSKSEKFRSSSKGERPEEEQAEGEGLEQEGTTSPRRGAFF